MAEDSKDTAPEGGAPTPAPVTPEPTPSPEPTSEPKPDDGKGDYSYKPEGGAIIADPKAWDEWQKEAKSAGLSEEQFSRVTKMGEKWLNNTLADVMKRAGEDSEKMKADSLADRELSEDGESLKPEVRADVNRVLDQFGSDEVKRAFDATGAGNHKEIIRMLAKIGKGMGMAGGAPGISARGTSGKKDAKEKAAAEADAFWSGDGTGKI